MKKILSALLSIFMLMGISSAFADDIQFEEWLDMSDKEVIGDFLYRKGTNAIIGYVGQNGICEVPDNTELENLWARGVKNTAPITKLIINGGVVIKNGLCVGVDEINTVEIREGVTELGSEFLTEAKSLEKVTLPSTLKKIGDNAFAKCKNLASIELPEGLQSIGKYAFEDCTALSGELIIPDTVTYIGYGAFYHTGKFKKVHISDSLKLEHKQYGEFNLMHAFDTEEINIPDIILNDPPRLEMDEITFNSDMTPAIYRAVKDSNWFKKKYLRGTTDKSMGNDKDFIIIDNTLLRYIGDSKNPVVPEGVHTICENAFTYCDIDSVELPKTLKTIEAQAFFFSTLKNITIPEGVKSVGEMALGNCPLLEKTDFKGTPEVKNITDSSGYIGEFHGVFFNFDGACENKGELEQWYQWLNFQRAEYGLAKIDVPNLSLSTAKPTSTATPQDTPNPNATTSPKPETTPLPTSEPTTSPIPQTLTVEGGEEIKISIDGEAVAFPDAKPFIDDNDRTQVPVRAVAEMLDCKVDWDGEIQTVTITKNGEVITLVIGEDVMSKNGEQVKMDTKAMIKEERTYIPVRFIAEAMGLTVDYK